MQDGKHVILCVDDDPDILNAMELVLESAGYAVVAVESAEQAKKRIKEVNPDLLIVDLMMEEIDSGASLVKELKVMGNDAPIYMLSAAGDTLSMTTDYTDLGLDGVFQKPVDPDTLLAVIKAKLK